MSLSGPVSRERPQRLPFDLSSTLEITYSVARRVLSMSGNILEVNDMQHRLSSVAVSTHSTHPLSLGLACSSVSPDISVGPSQRFTKGDCCRGTESYASAYGIDVQDRSKATPRTAYVLLKHHDAALDVHPMGSSG